MRRLLIFALLLATPVVAWADPISIYTFLYGLGISSGVAAFVASNALLIGGLLATAAVGNYQRRKAQAAARRAYNANLQDRLVTTAIQDAPRTRVYGRVRCCEGVRFKATFGTKSEFYRIIVSVASHEVTDIEEVYFNDARLVLDGTGIGAAANVTGAVDKNDNPVEVPYAKTTRKKGYQNGPFTATQHVVVLANTPVSGTVSVTVLGLTNEAGNELLTLANGGINSVVGSTVTYTPTGSVGINAYTAAISYDYDEVRSYATVRKYLGAAGQNLYTQSDIATDHPNLIEAGDKFEGMALVEVVLEYSQEAWQSGPPNITATVKGAKCYDPRSDTTAWTDNPFIIARDWSLYAYGGGVSAEHLDDTSFEAAADEADASTDFYLNSGESPTRHVQLPLYQAGIVCVLGEDPARYLEEMVEAGAGKWGWSGGKLKVVAGTYRAPVASIDEYWLSDAGPLSINREVPRSELVNSYRVTFSDREQDYVAVQAPPVRPATYITEDGAEYTREITCEAVTHVAHAQHIATVLLRDARESLSCELTCNLRAWTLELFDVVEVTLPRFGWVDKTFEVLGWRFNQSGTVTLNLKETEAAIYEVSDDFSDLGYDDNTELPSPWIVSPVSGLAATSTAEQLADGQIVTKTFISWSEHPDAAVTESGWIEVQLFKLGLTINTINWVNDQGDPVDWENNLSEEVIWEWLEANDPSGTGWITVRERGNQTGTVIVGLVSGAVYIIRARAETATWHSIWSGSIAHKVADVAGVATGITASLSSDAVILPADANGVVPAEAYASATTTLTIRAGQTDDTANWTIDKEDGLGITSTLDGSPYTDTVSVTAMSNGVDNSYVDFIATRSGYTTITKRYSISKARAGEAGPPGDPSTEPGPSAGGGNLFRNADFEERASGSYRPLGYTVYNNAGAAYSWVDRAGYNSNRAFAIRADAPFSNTFGLHTSLTQMTTDKLAGHPLWLANTEYRVSFYAKKVNGAAFVGGMGLAWNTAPTTQTALVNPELTTSYQRYEFKIIWGSSVEGDGRIYIYMLPWQGAKASNDEIWIDRLLVEAGQAVGPWRPHVADILGTPLMLVTRADFQFPADKNGAITAYTNNTTTISIYLGTVDDTTNWTLSRVNGSTDINSTLTNNVLTINSLAATKDSDYVEVTAGKAGYPNVVRRFVVTKSKTGADGATGPTGPTGPAGAIGPRGSISASRQISGSSWNDSEANAAISAAGYGLPVTLDIVTLYNVAGTYSETRVYSAGLWITYAAKVNGNLLVDGTVTAEALVASDKLFAGNIVGSALAQNYGATELTLTGGRVFVQQLTSNTFSLETPQLYDYYSVMNSVTGRLIFLTAPSYSGSNAPLFVNAIIAAVVQFSNNGTDWTAATGDGEQYHKLTYHLDVNSSYTIPMSLVTSKRAQYVGTVYNYSRVLFSITLEIRTLANSVHTTAMAQAWFGYDCKHLQVAD